MSKLTIEDSVTHYSNLSTCPGWIFWGADGGGVGADGGVGGIGGLDSGVCWAG